MNDEADLVLGVPVLAAELGEQGVEVGDLGVDVDDVGGDVATLALEAADGLLVGGEDFVGGGIFGEGVGALEAAVPDAELFEEGADGGGVLKDLTGVAECERCHAKILSRRGSKTGPSSLRWSALRRAGEWSSLRRFATRKSAPVGVEIQTPIGLHLRLCGIKRSGDRLKAGRSFCIDPKIVFGAGRPQVMFHFCFTRDLWRSRPQGPLPCQSCKATATVRLPSTPRRTPVRAPALRTRHTSSHVSLCTYPDWVSSPGRPASQQLPRRRHTAAPGCGADARGHSGGSERRRGRVAADNGRRGGGATRA